MSLWERDIDVQESPRKLRRVYKIMSNNRPGGRNIYRQRGGQSEGLRAGLSRRRLLRGQELKIGSILCTGDNNEDMEMVMH